jgi:sec-independent protein translocase protein TatA
MGVVGITIPQGPELILILAVLVLLFGAKKLPELGSSIGKTITNFKKGVAEGQAEDETAEEAVESGSDDRGASNS